MKQTQKWIITGLTTVSLGLVAPAVLSAVQPTVVYAEEQTEQVVGSENISIKKEVSVGDNSTTVDGQVLNTPNNGERVVDIRDSNGALVKSSKQSNTGYIYPWFADGYQAPKGESFKVETYTINNDTQQINPDSRESYDLISPSLDGQKENVTRAVPVDYNSIIVVPKDGDKRINSFGKLDEERHIEVRNSDGVPVAKHYNRKGSSLSSQQNYVFIDSRTISDYKFIGGQVYDVYKNGIKVREFTALDKNGNSVITTIPEKDTPNVPEEKVPNVDKEENTPKVLQEEPKGQPQDQPQVEPKDNNQATPVEPKPETRQPIVEKEAEPEVDDIDTFMKVPQSQNPEDKKTVSTVQNVSSKVQMPADSVASKTNQSNHLPATGEQVQSWLTGLGIAILVAVFGFVGYKAKHRQK